jgi:hypothetical protein
MTKGFMKRTVAKGLQCRGSATLKYDQVSGLNSFQLTQFGKAKTNRSKTTPILLVARRVSDPSPPWNRITLVCWIRITDPGGRKLPTKIE